MTGPKVFEFAKELGMSTIDLMDKLKQWGIPVKNHMVELDKAAVLKIQNMMEEEKQAPKKKAKKKTQVKKRASKKKVSKKKVSKKKVSKKTAPKKKASPRKKVTSKPISSSLKKKVRAKTVIRRKASVMAEVKEAEQKAKEEKVKKAEDAASRAQSTELKSTEKKRPNIIGKIDLEKRKSPVGKETPVQSRGRHVRTGFYSVQQNEISIMDPPTSRPGGREDKKRHPSSRVTEAESGAAKVSEEEKTGFSATEYRKREVIFQPRKKKVILNREFKKTQITMPKANKRVIKIHGNIQVSEFAQAMGTKVSKVIGLLMKNGVMVKQNEFIDSDTASLIAPEFNFEVKNIGKSIDDFIHAAAFGDIDAPSVSRPPIVTVMGHVDHGKTTLLDSIRKTNVVKGEAGGITQHIGAYQVILGDQSKITFLDTPGHEAFTAMRARGANVTDIAVIVVAADDGVMPQTQEAVNHAKSAGVPIIIAINKIDRQGANVDKIKQQLAEFDLVPEEWGGTTIFCEISALNGKGVSELLEQIKLVAEISELKANPKRSAIGVVIETLVEKGKGVVSTLLVQEGALKKSDIVVAGQSVGRIRVLYDDRGKVTKEALPGQPVKALGFQTPPAAGDLFHVCQTEKEALNIIELRKQNEDKSIVTPHAGVSLDQLFSKVQQGDIKELRIVLKTDVVGSAEAIKDMFDKMATEAVKIKVVHSAVGGISKSDVLLASTCNGIVIGFNVRPDGLAQNIAKSDGVEIKTYNIIYELMDDIQKAMKGLLAPKTVEVHVGRAEVRDTFNVPRIGVVAGCMVQDGKIIRSGLVRLVREGRSVYEGQISSLKRFKDDVKEISSGHECGLGIENFNDIKVGDIIEMYKIDEVAQEL